MAIFYKKLKFIMGKDFDYYCLGIDLFNDKKYKAAIINFSKAVKLDPGFFMAYIGLFDSYYALNQYEKCLKFINKALAIDNEDVEATNRFGKIKKWLEDRVDNERLTEVKVFLEKFDFVSADNLYFKMSSDISRNKYEELKSLYIEKDLMDLTREIRTPFDKEKARALSTIGKYVLVQARAGSGKTTLVALKVHQLIKYYGAKPEEILVLAFNKKATEEFRDRINKYCGSEIATDFNTLTFHALARRIANTNKNLLKDDEDEKNDHGKDSKLQTDFMMECFNEVEKKEENFIEKLIYSFFRAASEKIREMFRNDEDYYLYLRNLQQTTIAGEVVKSRGEKYIADFIFEHIISKTGEALEYEYEHNIKKLLDTARPYCPDFSLFFVDDEKKERLQVVIEFFGFTETNTGYPGIFETKKEAQDYLKKSAWVRDLFNSNEIDFIELSADDFDRITHRNVQDEESVRLEFENIVRQRLIDCGFDVSERLNTKKILAKISNLSRRKKRLVKQITQFINKAQKLFYTPKNIREMADAKKKNGNLSNRSESFIKMTCRVFEEYRSRLLKKPFFYTDWDGLFIDAIKKVKNEGGKCKIKSKNAEEEICNIKYILIDEYQDFSKLFYELINTMRTANPSILFFCVGDDWQAINGFAGSDLEYFNNFEKEYFVGGSRAELLTNYRSDKNIVRHSNLLMSGRGSGGESSKDKPNGAVYLSKLQWVELREDEEHLNEFNKDEKYRFAARSLVGLKSTDKKTPLEISRYLKTIEYIVRDKVDKKKEIYLLFRTNTLHGVKISKFTDKIQEWCPEPKKIKKKIDEEGVLVDRINCSTTHSFKGKESDVIIIVDANRRSYPKFHPDNELMEILGVTSAKVLEEERRLFYVAITRAKEQLYILYDEDLGRSDFILSSRQWTYLSLS